MPQRATNWALVGQVRGGHPLLGNPPPTFTWTDIHTFESVPGNLRGGEDWINSDTPLAANYIDRLIPISHVSEGMPAREREQMMQGERDLRDRMREQREREREERERLRRRLAPIAQSIARRMRRN